MIRTKNKLQFYQIIFAEHFDFLRGLCGNDIYSRCVYVVLEQRSYMHVNITIVEWNCALQNMLIIYIAFDVIYVESIYGVAKTLENIFRAV